MFVFAREVTVTEEAGGQDPPRATVTVSSCKLTNVSALN